MGSLYAGEEVTAVGQQGDWLHLRLYEFDDEEEDEDEDRDDDNDVRLRVARVSIVTEGVFLSLNLLFAFH